jgi:hypothetical protein
VHNAGPFEPPAAPIISLNSLRIPLKGNDFARNCAPYAPRQQLREATQYRRRHSALWKAIIECGKKKPELRNSGQG